MTNTLSQKFLARIIWPNGEVQYGLLSNYEIEQLLCRNCFIYIYYVS